MATNRANTIYIAIAVVAFAVLGLWAGRPADLQPTTFGGMLLTFAQDDRTRMLLFAILADVVTGVIAASRMGIADAMRTGAWFDTNILRYLLGYLLFYSVTMFGLEHVLPAPLIDAVASLGFATAITSITASIIDNIRRASLGYTPPLDEKTTADPLPPSDRG